MPPKIEDDVLDEMTIEPLQIPGKEAFAPKFTEEEMQNYEHRDKEILKAVKTLQNAVEWVMKEMVVMNSGMRQIEADTIRIGKSISSLATINRIAKTAKTLAWICVGAVFSKFGESLISRIFK